jgi:hypothetical protein
MVQPYRAIGIVIVGVVAASAAGCIFERYGESQVHVARAKALDLATKVELYYVNNGEQYPANLEVLTQPQPGGLSPLCAPEAILDPWGQEYQLQIFKDESGENRVEVFTFGPGGRISSLELPVAGPPDRTALIVTFGLVVALLVVVWLFREPKPTER